MAYTKTFKPHGPDKNRLCLHYFICMVNISSCLVVNDVLFKCILNHFHSVSHHHCEEENMVIKKAFEIDKKNKILVKLDVNKTILKKKKKRKKAQKKERQVRQRYQFYPKLNGLKQSGSRTHY